MKNKMLLWCMVALITTCYTKAGAQSVWTPQVSGVETTLYGVDFYDELTGIAVGEAGTILRTTDGGATWISCSNVTQEYLMSVTFYDALHAVIVGDNSTVLRTEDGGLTWNSIVIPNITRNFLSVDILPGGKGILCGDSQVLLWTDDGGLTWRTLREDYSGRFSAARMLDDETAFAYGHNGFFSHYFLRITQPNDTLKGFSFNIMYNGASTEGDIFDAYPFNDTSCVTVGSLSQLVATITCNQPFEDNLWDAVFLKEEYMLTGVDFIDNYGVAVGGGSSTIIVETQDKGLTWTEVTEEQKAQSSYFDVKLIGNTGYTVGSGGLIKKKAFPTGISSIEKANAVNVYPNPASDQVQFEFSLPAGQKATIRIFNPQGQMIKQTAVSAQQHDVVKASFVVSDLPSGCYFYQIQTDQDCFSGKFLVK